jgi:N-acetyl-beta-hexosaminidase
MLHAYFLETFLERIPGVELQTLRFQPGQELPARGIVLALAEDIEKTESYIMNITSRRILIQGDDAAGVFYGIQSLRQLLPH